MINKTFKEMRNIVTEKKDKRGERNQAVNKKKKRGSISVFLIIVIPLLIVGGIFLFDLLWLRYQDEKALKIVSAVSEAHLSRYNEYLKNEYHLVAGLNTDVLSESVDDYFSQNGYVSHTETLIKSLDDPENFKTVVVKSFISHISKALYDEFSDIIGVGRLKSELSRKLESIDKGMEQIADLIRLPNEMDKMTRTRDLESLKRYIGEMKDSIAENDSQFKSLSEELAEGLDEWEEIQKEVDGTLVKAEEKYNELKNQALEYAESVSNDIETIEKSISEGDACFEKIEELEKKLKEELSEEEAENIRKEISELTTKMDELDVIVQKTKTHLDLYLQNSVAAVEKGEFDSLTKKLKKVFERMTAIFNHSVSDGDTLKIKHFEGGIKALEMLEKIAFTEWCIGVMSCYEKNCEIEGRAVRGELEYVVSGIASERESLEATKFKIVELRVIPNYIAFLQTDLKKALDAFLIGIPVPFRQIAQVMCYSGCVLFESYHDVSMLLDGGKVPLIKKPKEWGMSWDELIGEDEIRSEKLKRGLSYKDYLRILIFFQDDMTTILRSMHVVNASVEKASDKKYELGDYSVGHVIEVDYFAKSVFSKRKSRIIYENAYD